MECLMSRKLQEEEDRINYTEGSLYVQQAPNGDGKEAPSLQKRASSRYRLREKNPKRKIHPVNSTTDTVQSLKLRIYQLLEVPPFQQALWFHDILLDNESSPVSSYRIPNGSDLTLVIVEGNPELLEEETASKEQCEEGFKGSIFYSKSSKDTIEPPAPTTEEQETTNNKEETEDTKIEKTNGKDHTTDESPSNTENENNKNESTSNNIIISNNNEDNNNDQQNNHLHENKDTNVQPQLNGHHIPSLPTSTPPTSIDEDVIMPDVVYVSIPLIDDESISKNRRD